MCTILIPKSWTTFCSWFSEVRLVAKTIQKHPKKKKRKETNHVLMFSYIKKHEVGVCTILRLWCGLCQWFCGYRVRICSQPGATEVVKSSMHKTGLSIWPHSGLIREQLFAVCISQSLSRSAKSKSRSFIEICSRQIWEIHHNHGISGFPGTLNKSLVVPWFWHARRMVCCLAHCHRQTWIFPQLPSENVLSWFLGKKTDPKTNIVNISPLKIDVSIRMIKMKFV